MTKPTVNVVVDAAELSVIIDDIPHLLLRRAELTGVAAFIVKANVDIPYFCIEFTMKDGATVTRDYEARELWADIMSRLFEASVFREHYGE